MSLITDSQSLAALCQRLSRADYVTVDTEFIRERTYWPELCLVQVAGPDDFAAIDPLAPGIDLAPLFALMDNGDVLKVFHAARQDLEIFLHLTGKLPHPLFDTQIAAMVCGFGEQVGYETLIAKLTKERVDKSSRFTDWAIRPLSQRQIDYALADVTHLRPAYEKLRRTFEATGRAGWLDEEMTALADPAVYVTEPEDAYLRLKVRGPKPKILAVLRELAAWREIEAQQRDLPRGRVLRDEALLEIAHHVPTTTDQLARTRGLSQRLAEGSQGQALLAAVKKALASPESAWPKPPPKKDLPKGIGPLADLLRVLLKAKCEDADVAQKLVASAADLEVIAAFGEQAGVAAMHGWRFEMFGRDALRLRAGDIALAAADKRVRVVEVAANAPAPGTN